MIGAFLFSTPVVKLGDAPDLGSGSERSAGSMPVRGTSNTGLVKLVNAMGLRLIGPQGLCRFEAGTRYISFGGYDGGVAADCKSATLRNAVSSNLTHRT